MKEFKGRVAVITGAANGIGRAIAFRCASEGMRVVLAGINESTLRKVEEELVSLGAVAISVQTDVSQRDDIEALAQRTMYEFGAVHLLVNNAGVAAGASPWRSTWHDWEWVLNVNLWGVIHGVKVFTPIMLKQSTESYIVNNSSIAGVVSCYPLAPYMVSKHAVVALSEILYHWLRRYNAQVKVSVLCTGPVESRIGDSWRNRPLELKDEPMEIDDVERLFYEQVDSISKNEMPAERVADMVFQAIRVEQFYIFTHPDLMQYVNYRTEDLKKACNPRFPKF
jgi:NAD(P)-dependent dehydrogenase (short-subunit alcohol dehydrogenase family)